MITFISFELSHEWFRVALHFKLWFKGAIVAKSERNPFITDATVNRFKGSAHLWRPQLTLTLPGLKKCHLTSPPPEDAGL